MICERCGWSAPVDCTCVQHGGRITASEVKVTVERRHHRQAVARVSLSEWAVGRRPATMRWAAA